MECCLLSQAMLIEESFNMSIDQIEKLPCLHNYINIAFCKIVRHNIVSQHLRCDKKNKIWNAFTNRSKISVFCGKAPNPLILFEYILLT